MTRLLRRLRADERGFTMVELITTMSLMTVVATMCFGLLHSLTTNDRYQEALVNNQQTVRFAVTQMARDLRSANPLETLPDVNDWATSFEVALGPTDGPQTYVRWELTDTALTRSVLDAPNGDAVTTRTVLDNVDNLALGVPMFRYYDEDGVEITTALTSGDFANCTIRVHINVSAADDPVGSFFQENSDAELRNRLPGGIGC